MLQQLHSRDSTRPVETRDDDPRFGRSSAYTGPLSPSGMRRRSSAGARCAKRPERAAARRWSSAAPASSQSRCRCAQCPRRPVALRRGAHPSRWRASLPSRTSRSRRGGPAGLKLAATRCAVRVGPLPRVDPVAGRAAAGRVGQPRYWPISPTWIIYGRFQAASLHQHLRYASNSGTATGMSKEEAVLHGLLEAVERDSFSFALLETQQAAFQGQRTASSGQRTCSSGGTAAG
jgi:hypothetical protein